MQLSHSQSIPEGLTPPAALALTLRTLGQSQSLKKDLKTDQNALSNNVFRIWQCHPTLRFQPNSSQTIFNSLVSYIVTWLPVHLCKYLDKLYLTGMKFWWERPDTDHNLIK